MPPKLVPANDSLWGTDPGEFWKRLVEECQQALPAEATPTADLDELAQKLRANDPSFESWVRQRIQIPENEDLWFIGDLHGDLLSFLALTEFAKRFSEQKQRRAAICFLGDLFDDGPFGHVVLQRVLARMVNSIPTPQDPNQTVGPQLDVNPLPASPPLFVVGNHDLALAWNAEEARFSADVTPHDFADWLNQQPPDSRWCTFVKTAITWLGRAPRALVLDDGTLVAHGGSVHSDRFALLREPEGWNHEDVKEDLVWLRAHDTAKRKVPNRTARGCQFGVEDLADFLTVLGQIVGQPIPRVIRGHDHVIDRWSAPPQHAGRLLTLNAMSWRQRDPLGPFARQPVIARHRTGESPEIHQIEIPEEHIIGLYGEKEEDECVTSEK